MRTIVAVSASLLLSGCGLAQRACDNMGYERGTALYLDCLREQRAAFAAPPMQYHPLEFHPVELPAPHNWTATCNRVGAFTYCNGN
jgi:hypothetical protein